MLSQSPDVRTNIRTNSCTICIACSQLYRLHTHTHTRHDTSPHRICMKYDMRMANIIILCDKIILACVWNAFLPKLRYEASDNVSAPISIGDDQNRFTEFGSHYDDQTQYEKRTRGNFSLFCRVRARLTFNSECVRCP